ncbi:MAG: hypothetical protein HFF04_07285 [Oscillospiraceae bacterium]|nr:hypothetical protein [Oscillospiraceae bacterium]
MKQGTVINRIVVFLFTAAILAYTGGAVWREMHNFYPTVQAYSYVVEDTIETTGYLVRQEQLLTGTGDIVRLIPAEGEKVAAGATVALLYDDEEALERDQQLEILETEAQQLSAAIEAAGESSQSDNSTQRATEALVALRASVESGDFTHLESQTVSFKSAVYQQAQRYGDAGDLAAALASIRAEADSLRRQAIQDTGYVTVAQSGIFSGRVDGYELVLTPDSLNDLTPSVLDELSHRVLPTGTTELGKLITNSTWYFACPLTETEARRLTVGGIVTVRFSRDWSGEVDMTVERMSPAENGRVAVVFSSNRYLSDTTLLRRQTVDLVFSQQTGIRVPKESVRVEEVQETDEDTGEERTAQVTCVYVEVGITAERKQVTVLAQGEDYYIVNPVLSQDAGASQEKKVLRPGDQVIIASGEIWDGKVLE